MIVYGDRIERVEAGDAIRALIADLDCIAAMPAGIERHGTLVAAFIRLGQIVQGTADADRERIGADGGSAAETALMEPLGMLAEALIASWDGMSASGSTNHLPTVCSAVRGLLGDPILPGTLSLSLPEGYAFYAVYPEAYAAAARKLVFAGPPRVIGVRSIGTGLAAIVAAVLRAPPPLTVRPVGHPFARTIALTEQAAAGIDPDGHYVVVDEGPGLSGSSFAAVADLLEARGVAPDRIAFLPSHAGAPGPRATPRTRERWQAAQRPVVGFDALIPPARLGVWAERLLGPLDRPAEDISGGGWRAYVFASEAEWPAVHAGQERRKFLVRAGGTTWLLKFAGLGAEGARKLARAEVLARAGLVPEVRGLVYGFVVQRWAAATPLDIHAPDAVEAAAYYLGTRARLLGGPVAGASLAELFAMARHNIGIAIGVAAARRFEARHGGFRALEPQVTRIATDNRGDAHEWLRLADGRVLKADALDHDAGHDLIGGQDLAWDVAGIAAEFDLAGDDVARLIAGVENAAGWTIDEGLLAFYGPCYLAFRLGAAQLAADALGGWPAEAGRNRAAVARYAAKLAASGYR